VEDDDDDAVPSTSLFRTLGDLIDNALAKKGAAIEKIHRSDFKLRSNRLEIFPLLLPSPPVR